jgi:hypothetical protein
VVFFLGAALEDIPIDLVGPEHCGDSRPGFALPISSCQHLVAINLKIHEQLTGHHLIGYTYIAPAAAHDGAVSDGAASTMTVPLSESSFCFGCDPGEEPI